jgi:hypothetical protein
MLLLLVRVQVKTLAAQEQHDRMSEAVKAKYSKVFNLILHVDQLPTDVYCRIKLKDASKTINTHIYSSPHKYKAVWAELIQQHLPHQTFQFCPCISCLSHSQV